MSDTLAIAAFLACLASTGALVWVCEKLRPAHGGVRGEDRETEVMR